MGVALDDLWGQVFRSTTESGSGLAGVGEELCQTKVSQLNVAVLVDEHVLRLQVSMDDLMLVEDTDSEHELGSIELDSFLGEAFDLEQVGVQIASPDVFEEEVDSAIILENIVHAK